MKKIASLILTLSMLIQVNAYTDPETSSSEKSLSGSEIAQKILTLFDHYKTKNKEACLDMMEELSFNLTKDMVQYTSKSSYVDSLVFENTELSRWAYYKSVDLGYLRDVEVVFVVKHHESELVLETVKEILVSKEKLAVSVSEEMGQRMVKLKDQAGAQVIDDRFKVHSVNQIRSLFSYELSTFDEYVVVDFKEVIPRTIVEEEKYLAQKELSLE